MEYTSNDQKRMAMSHCSRNLSIRNAPEGDSSLRLMKQLLRLLPTVSSYKLLSVERKTNNSSGWMATSFVQGVIIWVGSVVLGHLGLRVFQ